MCLIPWRVLSPDIAAHEKCPVCCYRRNITQKRNDEPAMKWMSFTNYIIKHNNIFVMTLLWVCKNCQNSNWFSTEKCDKFISGSLSEWFLQRMVNRPNEPYVNCTLQYIEYIQTNWIPRWYWYFVRKNQLHRYYTGPYEYTQIF